MRRGLTVLAVFAALAWILNSTSAPVNAQQEARTGEQGVRQNVTAAATPIVLARGERYAGVRGLAVDATDALYISLTSGAPSAQCVSQPAGDSPKPRASAKITITIFSNCTSAPGEDPSGIAVTPNGRVFLANRAQNRIRALDMATGKVAVVPAAGAKSVAQPATSNLDLFQPAGLALDTAENLYVADRGNYRVLALKPGAGKFSYVAHVLDAAAVAADQASDELYVASPASHRVFAIDPAYGNIDAFAGSGASSDSSAAPFPSPVPALSAAIVSPEGIAVDGAGNVFITDAGANTILRVDAKSGMLSRAGFATDLNSPGALTIDRSGDVFLADRGNTRVLEFPGAAAPALAGAITISPAQFDFGAEPKGGATAAQVFTLTNNSASAISLSTTNITFTGTNSADFSETTNCVPQVAAGASCQINVTFTPQASGARTAVLQVMDTDPSSPQTAQVSGTGDDFQIAAASGSSITQTIVPGNTATFNLQITPDQTFSGTVTPTCPLQLPQNTLTCAIKPATVSVTPGQAAMFTVTIGTGGPNATAFVPFAIGIFGGGAARGLFLATLTLVFLIFLLLRSKSQPQATLTPLLVEARRRSRLAISVITLCAGAAAAGCYHAPAGNPNETPPGIYDIDISASAQNASRAITITMNVQ